MTQKYTFSDDKSKVILRFLLQPIVNTILKTINAYECLSQIENITANKHYDKSTFFDNLDKNILKDIIIKQIIEINGNTNLIRSKKISINIPASLLLDIEYLNKIVTLSSFILAIEVTNMDINHDSFNILKKQMKHILKTSSTEFWLDDFRSNRYDIEIVRAFPWNSNKTR